MPVTLDQKLVIAISSRALFNLGESNTIFVEKGLREYTEYQINNEDNVLGPGVAFPLIKRLLALRYPESGECAVEVVLTSRNDANTGLRVFNSIEHHQLRITRAVFTKGRSPYQYLDPLKADLFLSADPADVRLALDSGHASATILTGLDHGEDDTEQLRIAFDGDAVLFSDEAERVFQEKGIEAFTKSEAEKSDIPLGEGPFKGFLASLNKIQKAYESFEQKPIRTALVTARNAPAHRRAIKTLRAWGISIDEAFFLGGLEKTPFLQVFRPHIFFDDQESHCKPASSVVPTGHVPMIAPDKEKQMAVETEQ